MLGRNLEGWVGSDNTYAYREHLYDSTHLYDEPGDSMHDNDNGSTHHHH